MARKTIYRWLFGNVHTPDPCSSDALERPSGVLSDISQRAFDSIWIKLGGNWQYTHQDYMSFLAFLENASFQDLSMVVNNPHSYLPITVLCSLMRLSVQYGLWTDYAFFYKQLIKEFRILHGAEISYQTAYQKQMIAQLLKDSPFRIRYPIHIDDTTAIAYIHSPEFKSGVVDDVLSLCL